MRCCCGAWNDEARRAVARSSVCAHHAHGALVSRAWVCRSRAGAFAVAKARSVQLSASVESAGQEHRGDHKLTTVLPIEAHGGAKGGEEALGDSAVAGSAGGFCSAAGAGWLRVQVPEARAEGLVAALVSSVTVCFGRLSAWPAARRLQLIAETGAGPNGLFSPEGRLLVSPAIAFVVGVFGRRIMLRRRI